MAWISKKVIQKKTLERKITAHPLLAELEVSLGLKTAYVNGCVLAALLDDEKVSEDEKFKVQRVGLSLGLSEEQIAESFTLVEGLASDDDKSAFIDELKGILAEPLVAKYFMTDFEEVMKKNGEVPESSVEFLDFIGLQITGEEDWRKALKNAAKKAKAVKKDESRGDEKEQSSNKDDLSGRGVRAREDEAAKSTYGFGDKVWRTNPEHNGIECSFDGKPSESVRNKLKAAGFRFSGKQGLWYAKDTDKTRSAMTALKLTCVDGDEAEVESDGAKSEEDVGPISVYELIALIEEGNITADVVDDEDCNPIIKEAEVSTNWSDECELKVTWGYSDDGPAGRLVFEVAGVRFSADRNYDGTHEPFEISGREIDYGDDELDEDSVLEAVEDNVSMTEFDSDDYEFDEDTVKVSDIIDVLGDEPDVYAKDDCDTVYGYSDSDDAKENHHRVIGQERAIKMIIADGKVEFEQE